MKKLINTMFDFIYYQNMIAYIYYKEERFFHTPNIRKLIKNDSVQ